MVAAQIYISRPYILELGLKPDLVLVLQQLQEPEPARSRAA